MYTIELVKAVVNSHHGWAVADQFEDTFRSDSFEKQNYNALLYIRTVVEDLLSSDVLSETALDELQEYRDELENYIAGPKDEEEYNMEEAE